MELATLAEFRYIPRWRGNREAAEGQRGSVVLTPLTGIDVLIDRTDEDMRSWADRRLKPIGARDAHLKMLIPSLDMIALRVLRVIDDHTLGCDGWLLHGEPVDDVVEVILRGFPGTGYGSERVPCSACKGLGVVSPTQPPSGAPGPSCEVCKGLGTVDGNPQSLMMELNTALAEASVLTEDELGNWMRPSAGTASTAPPSAMPAGTAASPAPASTPEATIEEEKESASAS
uniref:Uncharacterized protein n=1 Tax=viral metagenome TaxID=1070528 RepID=A0A6M3J2B7_9ZZZZ